jgi:ribosomal protein S18 acetylase RimI-like enzyme
MPTFSPILTDPDPKDLEFLEERIIEFNYDATGYRDGENLAIFVRDEQNEIIAGLSGFTWGGACKIEWLWVSADQRGQGLGRDLLLRAEEETIRRGCQVIVLDTHTFQAPGFYQKLGYEIMGEYHDFPEGHGQVFLRKRLPGRASV